MNNSAQVMKQINSLMNVKELSQTMNEMQKEMMKVLFIIYI